MARRPSCVLVHDGLPIMPAGLPAMAARLEAEGHPAQVWSLHAERRAGILRDLARDLRGVRLLAVSVHWFYQLPHAIRLVREARQSGFEGFVVLGGFSASLWAREILHGHPEVDGVIRGDGELPLCVMAHELQAARPRKGRVPNLVFRSRGGIRTNPFTYVGGSREVDSLDFGRLDLIRNLDAHLEHSSWRAITDGSPSVGLDLSATFYLCGGRGCAVACTTCGGGRLAHRSHSRRRRVTFRSPSRLADDVQAATALGCTSIHACFDPVPGGEHWHRFMDEISRRSIHVPMVFECFGLPDDRFLDHFASTFAGGIIVISAETAREDVRHRIRGFPFTNAQLERVLGRIDALGLRAQVFLGYFAPTEGVRGLYASRRWARDLARRFGGCTEVLHYPYSTDPGSPLARHPERFSMKCSVRTAGDWEREIEAQEPWLGNLMRHEPDTGAGSVFDALTLGIELEQACSRELPRVHASLESKLGPGLDPFFTKLASQVLATHERSSLDRSRLGRILLDVMRPGIPGRIR